MKSFLQQNLKTNRKLFFDIFLKNKIKLVNIIKVSQNKKEDIFILNKKIYNFKILNFLLQFEKRKQQNKKISILDLCINLNYIIPHYCYHFNLSIAGNCRMCLVELSTSQKPIVSCAIELLPNSNINTDSFLVKRARENIMEFLLVNHPLDCPICDQGGECDLQDQSLIYGSDRGRFYHSEDLKRSVNDFMCHPMIKVILTRCIHCTRCVRFLNEIEGNYSLGMVGRGNLSEIGLYTSTLLTSELGTNITDICPVGALTVKNYALKYRSWDDFYIESIDLSDSHCRSVRLYVNSSKILRLLPQYDNELDNNWIHDKTRFVVDNLISIQKKYPFLIKQSLNSLNYFTLKKKEKILYFNLIKNPVYFKLKYRPRMMNKYLIFDKKKLLDFDKENYKNKINLFSTYFKISWNTFALLFVKLLRNKSTKLIFKTFVGESISLFNLVDIKEFSLKIGSNYIYNLTEKNISFKRNLINEDFDFNYIYKIPNFQRFKNFFLLNINLRFENPIINSQLRQRKIWDLETNIYYIGPKNDLTYKYIHLGTNTRILLKLLEGRKFIFNFLNKRNLKNYSLNLVLYGSELRKSYKNEFYRVFFDYLKKLNNFFEVSYIMNGASSMGSYDLSLDRVVSKKNLYKNEGFNYFIGCNQSFIETKGYYTNIDFNLHKLSIYQNSFFDKYFNFCDYFLPTYSHYEKLSEYYINFFGILKRTRQIFLPNNLWVKDNKDIINIVYNFFFYNVVLSKEKLINNLFFFSLKRYKARYFRSSGYYYSFIGRYKKAFERFIKNFLIKKVFNTPRSNSIFLDNYKSSVLKHEYHSVFLDAEGNFSEINFNEFFLIREKFCNNTKLMFARNLRLTNYCRRNSTISKIYKLKFLKLNSIYRRLNLKKEKFFSKFSLGKVCSNLRIYSYIPLNLYFKRRYLLFNVNEKKMKYSFIFFYLFSSKMRNFFKMGSLSIFSRNMNLISTINFSNKSNFNL